MLPHQQRVVDEKTELDEKLTKLEAFFKTAIFMGLDSKEQDRLMRQSTYMNSYSEVLRERIDNF